MKVKYNEAVTPLVGEHSGFVFQQSRTCDCATTSKKNDRSRYTRQRQKMPNLMKAVGHWRNLDPVSKTAWSTFAATYPQPCKNPDSGFLTGYQLFIKRQQYCFLNYGLSDEFLEAPLMQELIPFDFTFDVSASGMVIDVTENWIKNFGKLPEVGQNLLIKILPYSVASGQFFTPINQQITVENVYMDGLFVSLFFPVPVPDVVFSVYLSFPTSHGRKYQNSQSRYMGCFTSKTFLQLTDTPGSYEGQAGKTVTVKEDESGLEFTEPSGGGLTCEDLPACPTIISINQDITNLENAIVTGTYQSLPVVRFGLIYNPLVKDLSTIVSGGGWRIPLYASDVLPWAAALGGYATLGQKLKLNDALYWNTIASNLNTYLMNFKGAGLRSSAGAYSNFKTRFQFWTKENNPFPAFGYATDLSNAFATGSVYNNSSRDGSSIILCRDAAGVANGVKGTYRGNNGIIYRTIVLNQKEWTTDPLAETLLSNGTPIQLITDDTAWSIAGIPGYCYPNGNINNV